ncbi:MAG: anti-sigma factor [Planctomycetota bacterium]
MIDDRHAFDAQARAIEGLEPSRREELLVAYLDDELSPDAARRVTAWLDRHPEALRHLEHRRRVWDLLELYGDAPVPEGFAARVLAGAGVRLGRRPRAPWLLGGLVAAAAVAVLSLGLALRRSPTPTPVPAPEQEVARVLDSVPPDLLEDVDVLISLSDEEFQGVLLDDLDTP